MLIPKNNRLVCRRLPADEPAAFIIPDAIKEFPNKSEVVSASEGSDYQPGQIVIHHQASGIPIAVNGEDLLILRETDIYAIIK